MSVPQCHVSAMSVLLLLLLLLLQLLLLLLLLLLCCAAAAAAAVLLLLVRIRLKSKRLKIDPYALNKCRKNSTYMLSCIGCIG